MIFVNFKTYPQGSGPKAVKLAQICQLVYLNSRVPIIPCVQAVDLALVVKAVKIPVWVQHLDPVEPGKNTGYVTAEAVKHHGAAGTLLNHSEHPLDFTSLKEAMNLAKETGLKTLVLVKDLDLASVVDNLRPDYLGLEEPKLIGSGTAMVKSPALRKIISDFVSQTKNAIPVIGAGISSREDIKQSLALGAKGVLVASAVVLVPDQSAVLKELARAFKSN